MLTLDPLDPLCNAVVEILAKSPGITVAELKKKLDQRKTAVTLQHVYRLLTRLGDAQVVLKHKKTLSLNLLWLSYIELFAQGAREKLFQNRDLPVLSNLREGARVSLTAHSLHEVQTLWHHLLIHLNALLPKDETRVLHKYYSHAYWLLRPDADSDFYREIAKHVECHWLIGNETLPDLDVQRKYKSIFAIAVTDSPPFPAEGYLINVFGEYVIECVLPKSLSDHLALLFRSIRSAKDWKPELLESLFHLRAACTVTVWRSRKRADGLRAKIARLMPKGRAIS